MTRNASTSLTAAALLLTSVALTAQTTGTSHPEDLHDTITITPAPAPPVVKPSPLIPAPATEAPVQPSPVLLQRTSVPQAVPAAEHYVPPAKRAEPVETASIAGDRRDLEVTDDPDSGVVIDVPSGPNEMPRGTLVHTSLTAEISTLLTKRGDSFTARLLQPLVRHGVVLVPAESMLSGRVTNVHAGNRLHGGPAIQLVPELLTLPDGTKYRLDAQVVDLPWANDVKISDEGVIRGTEHWKRDAAGIGLTTASATVAGAVIGGGLGAAVGATVGVGIATVWYFRHEQEQTLPANTEIVFSLDRSLTVTPAAQ